MIQGAPIACAVLIFGIAAVQCNARQNMDHLNRMKESYQSIECYECNSAYDPRCGDPFNPYTIGKVNCSLKKPLNHIDFKPTLCRKTVQMVQGNLRVIRGCGYVPDDRDDKACLRRTGTHEITVHYCSCKHSLCNGTTLKSASTRIILGALLAAITWHN